MRWVRLIFRDMIIQLAHGSFCEDAVQMSAEIFHWQKSWKTEGYPTTVGDAEGGYTPHVRIIGNRPICCYLAIRQAGYKLTWTLVLRWILQQADFTRTANITWHWTSNHRRQEMSSAYKALLERVCSLDWGWIEQKSLGRWENDGWWAICAIGWRRSLGDECRGDWSVELKKRLAMQS